MLLAHGLVMNGGVEHAVECLTPEEFAATKEGYRYFELPDVAALLDVLRVPACPTAKSQGRRHWILATVH
jgi:hypothetical protein